MKREVTGEGLFWALAVVLAALALIAAITGFIMGAGDQLPAYTTMAVVSIGVLVSFTSYRRRSKAATLETPAQPERPRYVLLVVTWAVVLLGALVAAILIDGPKRVPWILVAGVASWQALAWERRRRRALRDLDHE